MKKIGILGGGQLGMLLAQSIARLGAEALIYDPDPEAPACRVVKTSINSSWQDKKALAQFLSLCDKATYEFENVPYESLAELNYPTPIFPSLNVLKITQNRAQEKAFLRQNKLPHVPYIEANSLTELEKQIDHLPFPVIIKSTTGGYDGKSQLFIKTKEELKNILSETKTLPSFPIVIEHAIDLLMEVSCITGSTSIERQIVFPVFENVHSNHILDTTTVPANISQELTSAIQSLATQAMQHLKVTGILCTEFFISHKNEKIKSALTVGDFNLYINEFAPRPHNSGHVTVSSCHLSQFDILARILLEIPISQPVISNDTYFCMANLLGDSWLAQGTKDGDKLSLASLVDYKDPIQIILYGKKEARSGRKMGHLITQAKTAEQAKSVALAVRKKLTDNNCLK